MEKFVYSNEHPHTRYNPLKNEWILVSPHRSMRPWKGQLESNNEEKNSSVAVSTIESNENFNQINNPLAPNSIRSNGEINPDYTSTYVFDNDFPALFDVKSIEITTNTIKEEKNVEAMTIKITSASAVEEEYSSLQALNIKEKDVKINEKNNNYNDDDDDNDEKSVEKDEKNSASTSNERYITDTMVSMQTSAVNPQVTTIDDSDTAVIVNTSTANSVKLIDERKSNKRDEEMKMNLFFQREEAKGCCRVLCYHPNTNISVSEMNDEDILNIINTMCTEFTALSSKYNWVQIFENKGQTMGCSNPHPHGQIWASNFLPNEARLECETQLSYYEKYQSSMLIDYLNIELSKGERIICENTHWVVLTPYWAIWPYETMILPKRTSIKRINELSIEEKSSLAKITKCLLIKYDNLFSTSFPYSMGWHCAPTGEYGDRDKHKCEYWLLHAHYYPPLLRSASVKKFMVGYEMLAQPQRDITPEEAAEKLRKISDIHYKKRL